MPIIEPGADGPVARTLPLCHATPLVTASNFSFQISCQHRLSNQMTHLSTLLNASVGGNDGANAFYNRLNSRFSTCVEEEKRGVEREIRFGLRVPPCFARI